MLFLLFWIMQNIDRTPLAVLNPANDAREDAYS
jgi:hypothetical protein